METMRVGRRLLTLGRGGGGGASTRLPLSEVGQRILPDVVTAAEPPEPADSTGGTAWKVQVSRDCRARELRLMSLS